MATQPTTDAPFGLQPNVAAGLAWLFSWLGGLIMLFGGGTNKTVKWAAAQSITFAIAYFALWIVVTILEVVLGMMHLGVISGILALVMFVVFLGFFIMTVVAAIQGFQGKDYRMPFIADYAPKIFGGQLA